MREVPDEEAIQEYGADLVVAVLGAIEQSETSPQCHPRRHAQGPRQPAHQATGPAQGAEDAGGA
eukprot:4229253-Lingulodinium_polyedra.AAC.1